MRGGALKQKEQMKKWSKPTVALIQVITRTETGTDVAVDEDTLTDINQRRFYSPSP